MAAVTTDLVVRKTVTVPLAPEQAFALFTESMGSWWPTASHSIHANEVARVVFETRAGGEVYEETVAGEKALWAIVREYDPPSSLMLEWRVNPDRPATEVEVRFTPDGAGTRVDLEHRGWDDGDERRDGYDRGWEVVLGRFEAAAA